MVSLIKAGILAAALTSSSGMAQSIYRVSCQAYDGPLNGGSIFSLVIFPMGGNLVLQADSCTRYHGDGCIDPGADFGTFPVTRSQDGSYAGDRVVFKEVTLGRDVRVFRFIMDGSVVKDFEEDQCGVVKRNPAE